VAHTFTTGLQSLKLYYVNFSPHFSINYILSSEQSITYSRSYWHRH